MSTNKDSKKYLHEIQQEIEFWVGKRFVDYLNTGTGQEIFASGPHLEDTGMFSPTPDIIDTGIYRYWVNYPEIVYNEQIEDTKSIIEVKKFVIVFNVDEKGIIQSVNVTVKSKPIRRIKYQKIDI